MNPELWIPVTSLLLRPEQVKLENGAFLFTYPTPTLAEVKRPRPRTPRNLWKSFIALDGAADAAIHEFARRYGALHGAWPGPEDIRLWRSEISILYSAYEGLRQFEKGGAADLGALYEATKIHATDFATRQGIVARALSEMVQRVRAGGTKLSFGWSREHKFTATLLTDSLTVTVALQVIQQFISLRMRPVTCAGCGRPLIVKSRSRARQFCNRCRTNSEPSRLRQRRYRLRQKAQKP